MDSEMAQLIGVGIIMLAQAYVVQPWNFPIMAAIWDSIAILAAQLANAFAWLAMHARSNYYLAVNNVY
jgi:uncharacterized membrane protein